MRNGEVLTDPNLEQCPPLPHNFEINQDEAEAVADRRRSDKKGVPNAQKMAMDFSREDWRQYRWAYNRLVDKVDAQVGRLLKALEDEGLADNTVVIFTSDHGDGYGAHRWHQKSVLYDESCRVPFIISVPGGARRNETDDRLISVGIDLMATVSDLVGTEMPDGPYYGISAMPFVMSRAGKAPSHPYVVTEAEVRDSPGGDYEGRSVRSSQFKYHVWNKGARREQLFDMVKDPGETTNLAGREEFAPQLARHRAMLADWLKRTDDNFESP
jgi:arylsulfatase A-like enzyme